MSEAASIFMEKSQMPSVEDLTDALKGTHEYWQKIHDYVFDQYPDGISEWNFPGKKYGWSFRIKGKRRAIIYLLPRHGYFQVAFVFGQKATDAILVSDVSDDIKTELEQARVYGEGGGIRIDVRNENPIGDIRNLVEIKLAY